jgi:excisionase family DNA binding protein
MTPNATSGRKTAPLQKGSHSGLRGAGRGISLVDIDEVASWLGVETGFVRRLIAQRRIPFVKIGKFVRFDAVEIATWIDGQRVGVEASSRRRNWRN